MIGKMVTLLVLCLWIYPTTGFPRPENRARARDMGIEVGTMNTGRLNAITDVPGVRVGQVGLRRGNDVRTGVTVVLPHSGNLFREKVPAAIYCFNAFGKLAGYTQVEELGNIETPVVLTNTLSVATCVTAVIRYTLNRRGNEDVRSVNPVVGETNDGYLNDIRGLHVREGDVFRAISGASSGPVDEGSVGAGTGTAAFGFKGGIGTASRMTPPINGTGHTVGVLVQSNFGRRLTINGVPFRREMTPKGHKNGEAIGDQGSCMIVIATDAPLSPRNLKRLAKRSFVGMGRTTSVMTNGSGDYAIAFTTAYRVHHGGSGRVKVPDLVGNDAMTILFQAVEEATQEAIYNSLFMATTTRGYRGHVREAIPLDTVVSLMKKHRMVNLDNR